MHYVQSFIEGVFAWLNYLLVASTIVLVVLFFRKPR